MNNLFIGVILVVISVIAALAAAWYWRIDSPVIIPTDRKFTDTYVGGELLESRMESIQMEALEAYISVMKELLSDSEVEDFLDHDPIYALYIERWEGNMEMACHLRAAARN